MTDYRILITCWIGCSLLLSCNGPHESSKASTDCFRFAVCAVAESNWK